MFNLITTIIISTAIVFGGFTYLNQNDIILGAPVSNHFRNLLPRTNQTYDLGTTTPAFEWRNVFTQNITVSGTCTGCGSPASDKWATTSASINGIFPNGGATIDILIGGTATSTKSKLEVVGSLTVTGIATTSVLNADSTTGTSTFTNALAIGTGGDWFLESLTTGLNAGRPFFNGLPDTAKITGQLLVDGGDIDGSGDGQAAFEVYGDTGQGEPWFRVYDTSNVNNASIVLNIERGNSGTEGYLYVGEQSGNSRLFIGNTVDYIQGNTSGGDWIITTDFTASTDSVETLGSASVFWGALYVDDIISAIDVGTSVAVGTTSPFAKLTVWQDTLATGALAFEVVNSASTTLFSIDDNGVVHFNSTANISGASAGIMSVTGRFQPQTGTTQDFGDSSHYWDDGYFDNIHIQGAGFIQGLSSSFAVSQNWTPNADSARALGVTGRYWDLAFIDEVILHNDGISATAANEVRLSGLDLSAGDSGLQIRTENDTDHLFASKVGLNTTTPGSLLTVDAGGTATTTLDFGRLCIKALDGADGTTIRYVSIQAGVWVVSTKSCQ